MDLSSYVTQDPEVLSAVDRYTRASMMMVYMTQREVEQLAPIKDHNHQCVAIWTWVAVIIRGLNEHGLVKSQWVLKQLLQQAQAGRQAAQLIMNQLACPVPMSYVALIS